MVDAVERNGELTAETSLLECTASGRISSHQLAQEAPAALVAGSFDSDSISRVRNELLANPLGSGALSADTSAAAEQLQISRWREMAPSEKLKIVADVCSSTRELALVGIRQRHPGASDAECHLRFAQLTLGPTLADAAYPEAQSLLVP